jgi:hypothetical protein
MFATALGQGQLRPRMRGMQQMPSFRCAPQANIVTRELDPRVHQMMDGRVKPGHDDCEKGAVRALQYK